MSQHYSGWDAVCTVTVPKNDVKEFLETLDLYSDKCSVSAYEVRNEKNEFIRLKQEMMESIKRAEKQSEQAAKKIETKQKQLGSKMKEVAKIGKTVKEYLD